MMLGLISKRFFATTKPSKSAVVTKIKNIRSLVGFDGSDNLVKHQNVQVILKDDLIHKIQDNKAPDETAIDVEIDAQDGLVTPAFVDPHTHIFPPKDRAHEFAQRAVKTYEQIAAEGGGILSSVKACRESTEEELYAVNERNVKRFIELGTLTLEMKSGYGLDLENELRQLRVINKLRKKYAKQIEIIPTFMGAHAYPPEFKGREDEYIELIREQMIPAIRKERLAEFCDVFVEQGYFDYNQSKKILKKARSKKFKLRIHADEFVDSKGAQLAKEMGAYSADHLMAISDLGVTQLKEGNVVATILPGSTVFLGKDKFAPVDALIKEGVRVAIGTDYNPGSSTFNSQPMMMTFAMTYGKMSLEDAFKGVTRNAALSLGRKETGIIEESARADLLIWNLQELAQIPYYHYNATQFITHRVKKGKLVNLKADKKKAVVEKETTPESPKQ